jgi:hypothetical protein
VLASLRLPLHQRVGERNRDGCGAGRAVSRCGRDEAGAVDANVLGERVDGEDVRLLEDERVDVASPRCAQWPAVPSGMVRLRSCRLNLS